LPPTQNSASGGFVPISSLSAEKMSFVNEIFKISLFLPEGVKTAFENTKRASTLRQSNGQKTTRINDQVFLAMGIMPSLNTSRIIDHTWK
jgi:hypothetical protein